MVSGEWECPEEGITSCQLQCKGNKTLVGGGLAICGLGGVWTANSSRCSSRRNRIKDIAVKTLSFARL